MRARAKHCGWRLGLLAVGAFVVALLTLSSLRHPTARTSISALGIRRAGLLSSCQKKNESELLAERRCSGDAWPEPSAAPTAPRTALQCPRKVIFGNQRSWMGYVSSEFGFLFEALRVYHGWSYLSWFVPDSWDAVAEHYRSTFGASCELPRVLLFVEQYDVLPRLNASTGALRAAGTQM
jgi:hypothetical protein